MKTKQQLMEEMLFEAVKENNVEEVRGLLALGMDVNMHIDGRTLLHLASANNAIETAKALIKAGAKVDVQDKRKQTPLHYAARNNRPNIAKMLIKAGADVNAQDKYYQFSQTPLDWAVRGNHLEVAKVLLKADAKVCSKILRNSRESKVAIMVRKEIQSREKSIKAEILTQMQAIKVV